MLGAKLMSSDAARYCSGWNFGPLPGNELPVHEIVEQVIRHWGRGSWVDASDPQQPLESHTLRLAIDKALWQLGWRPVWDVREALRQTVRWYRAFYERTECMASFGRRQIEEFEAEFFAESTRCGTPATIDVDHSAPLHAIN